MSNSLLSATISPAAYSKSTAESPSDHDSKTAATMALHALFCRSPTGVNSSETGSTCLG